MENTQMNVSERIQGYQVLWNELKGAFEHEYVALAVLAELGKDKRMQLARMDRAYRTPAKPLQVEFMAQHGQAQGQVQAPATERQLKWLKHNVGEGNFPEGISKLEASKLIDFKKNGAS